MSGQLNDKSVVIAGLGLRLGPHPLNVDNDVSSTRVENVSSVFVTELLSGGAAERSSLLRVNDEILHVDHITTFGRSVSDVKNWILGVPGTSVRIGIRRNSEVFELSFVRGHPGHGSNTANSCQGSTATQEGTPSNTQTNSTTLARPTPKALFRSPGDKALHADIQMTLHEAAQRGNMNQVSMISSELISLAAKGETEAVRRLVNEFPDLKLSCKTCHVTPLPHGLSASSAPTQLFDGASPGPPACADREAAQRLADMVESVMQACGTAAAAPPLDRCLLRDLMLQTAAACGRVLEGEPRLLELPGACYVLGDVHGNLADLDFFRRCLWPVGVSACAADLVFLGDLVDRGADSVPVAAYMLAVKVLYPGQWWMIRGNHETREVNGNTKTYREGSFLHQCLRVFGDDDGRLVWEAVNDCFDALPLAARLGGQVFCVHGGVPRELCQVGARLEDINEVACPLRAVRRGDMVHAMLWSDPIPPDREGPAHQDLLDDLGFGLSSRGCCCFGEKTLDIFCQMHALKFVFRGHEAQQGGIGLSRSARLCTIFSTSKDHFTDDTPATCGCVLVARGTVLPIIRTALGLVPARAPLPDPPPPPTRFSAPAPAPPSSAAACLAATPSAAALLSGKLRAPLGRLDGNLGGGRLGAAAAAAARKALEAGDAKDPLFVF